MEKNVFAPVLPKITVETLETNADLAELVERIKNTDAVHVVGLLGEDIETLRATQIPGRKGPGVITYGPLGTVFAEAGFNVVTSENGYLYVTVEESVLYGTFTSVPVELFLPTGTHLRTVSAQRK